MSKINVAALMSSDIASEVENMLRRRGFLTSYDYHRSDKYNGDEIFGITDIKIDRIDKVGASTYRGRLVICWSDTATFGNEDNCERAAAVIMKKIDGEKLFSGDAEFVGVRSEFAWCNFGDGDGYSLDNYDLSFLDTSIPNDKYDHAWPISDMIFEISFKDDVDAVEPDERIAA